MWRGRPFDFGQGKLSPAKGADFYSSAVRSRDPQTIVIRSQLYRLRFAFTEEYGKKIDIDFRFGNRVVYPLPLIYAFHRFSVSVRSQIFEFTALTRKILSAWYLRLSKSRLT